MPARCLVFLLLLPAPALPAQLYKCADDSDRPSYQSSPCGSGARTLWVRTVADDAPPARPAARVSPDAAPATRAPPARTTTRTRRPAKSDPAAARCARARRDAQATRDRLWNRLSFRQRSELDARVARACSR